MQRAFFRLILLTILFVPFSTQASEVENRGFVLRSTLWDTLDIPVCWESLSTSSAIHRIQVQYAVKYSWEQKSKVRFRGWGLCTASAKGIRIQVADTGPHVKGLGTRIDGMVNGMVLNFTYANWSPSCQTSVKYCNEVIAIHEFGHALGFAHEHNRGDTPGLCLESPQGTDGDITIGDWDLYSVMNYCNPRYSNDGELSATDKLTLATFYGLPDSHILGRWAANQGVYPAQVKWAVGDFNGDGNDDIAKIYNDGGLASISYHLSDGVGSFTLRRRATRQGGFSLRQKWLAGDVNGDGRDELINVFPDQGKASITVHGYTGSTYGRTRWATRQGAFADDQLWRVGDFDGDGKEDLVNIFSDQGKASIDVHIAGTGTFTLSRWVTQQGGLWKSQRWLAGDLNGDGKDDLVRLFPHGTGTVSIDVLAAGTNTFTVDRWLTKAGSTSNTDTWLTGEFTGDGQFDLITMHRDSYGFTSGHLYEADGIRFAPAQFQSIRSQGGFSTAFNWLVGDFNGDGRDDVAKTFKTGTTVGIGVHKSICRDLVEFCR